MLEKIAGVLLDTPETVQRTDLLEGTDNSIRRILLFGELDESLTELTVRPRRGRPRTPSRGRKESSLPVDVTSGVDLGRYEPLLRAHLKRLLLSFSLLDELLVLSMSILDDISSDALPCIVDSVRLESVGVRRAGDGEDGGERVEVGGSAGELGAGESIRVGADERATGLEGEDRVIAFPGALDSLVVVLRWGEKVSFVRACLAKIENEEEPLTMLERPV